MADALLDLCILGPYRARMPRLCTLHTGPTLLSSVSLFCRGWGELGEGADIPPTVLLLDAVPHDWLLPRCAAAVHHGGAGTTAASLTWACPTTVVYFFGDQPFWGMACYKCAPQPASRACGVHGTLACRRTGVPLLCSGPRGARASWIPEGHPFF